MKDTLYVLFIILGGVGFGVVTSKEYAFIIKYFKKLFKPSETF